MKKNLRTAGINFPRIPHTFHILHRSSNVSCLYFLAFVFLSAIVSSPSINAAPRETATSVFATSIMGKQVELNGSPMPAGATLFPGDVVRLGEEVAAPQAGELAGDGVRLVGVLERARVRLRIVLAGHDVVARHAPAHWPGWRCR